MARVASGFYDPDGNDTVSFRVKLDGVEAGHVLVDAAAGLFEWTCDTSRIPAGEHAVEITATDELGASSTLNVALTINNNLPDRAWRFEHFGTAASQGAAADEADPDGDGLCNFGEFAFGGDPWQADGGSGTARVGAGAGGQGPRAVFKRRGDHAEAGLSYVAEFSGDLQQWTPGEAEPQVLSEEGGMQEVSVPFPALPPGPSAQFFRVRVEFVAP